jgi:DNA-directed RNA polymerase specialized sigma24 family protein
MKFFETNEPYQIVDDMTGGHQLAPDLVAHVFLIMQSKSNIENERGYFISIASRQWKYSQSEFNKEFRPVYTSEIDEEHISMDEDIISNDKYKTFLSDYIEQKPPTVEKWYLREITLLWLNGMTYREISQKTTINIRYITEAIKQFKNDVLNSYNSHRDNSNNNERDSYAEH